LVATFLSLALLGHQLSEASDTVHDEVEEVVESSETDPVADNMIPTDLLMIEEVEGISIGDDVTNICPANVDEGKSRLSNDVCVDGLRCSDAAEEKNLDQGYQGRDTPLVEDKE